MSISGPEALAALDEALRDLRREEDDILRKLVRGLERLAKLRDGEAELLRQLAESRLGPEAAAGLNGAVADAGRALRSVLDARGRELATAGQHRRQLETALAERRTTRAALLAEIDHLQQALRALSPRIAAAIGRDGAYETQRLEAARLATIAVAARTKSRQAALEREQKAQPFRSDPLFGYLLDRHYGTPAHRANAVTRALDGWLARLIRFEAAHADYALLEALPGALAAHAEAEDRHAAAAQDTLDSLEDAAIDSVGGGELRHAMAVAKSRLAGIDAELAEIETERAALVAAQTGLLAIDDTAFASAVATLIDALGSADLATLVAAMREDAAADAAMLAQIDDVRLRLAEEQADSRDLRARLTTLAQRRAALEGIEDELKTRQLDDPRALFHDAGLVGPRLDSFLVGETDAETYFGQWLAARGWSAGTAEWGGGIGLLHHGRGLVEAPRRQAAQRRPAAADLPS